MKRAREEAPRPCEDTCSSPWFDLLVDDTRAAVRHALDPLQGLLLSLTCQAERVFWQRPTKATGKPLRTWRLVGGFGTVVFCRRMRFLSLKGLGYGAFHSIVKGALWFGNVPLLTRMRMLNFICDSIRFVRSALEGGNMAAVRWCFKYFPEIITTDTVLLLEPAKCNRFKLFRFCIKRLRNSAPDLAIRTNCILKFAQHGNVEALRYCVFTLRWTDTEMLRTMLWHALEARRLAVLDWWFSIDNTALIEKSLCSQIFSQAAAHGDLSLLATLKARGCAMDGRAYVKAAEARQKDVLRWLLEHNCPMDQQ
jgi:hypothetical protein